MVKIRIYPIRQESIAIIVAYLCSGSEIARQAGFSNNDLIIRH